MADPAQATFLRNRTRRTSVVEVSAVRPPPQHLALPSVTLHRHVLACARRPWFPARAGAVHDPRSKHARMIPPLRVSSRTSCRSPAGAHAHTRQQEFAEAQKGSQVAGAIAGVVARVRVRGVPAY